MFIFRGNTATCQENNALHIEHTNTF